MVFVRGLLTKKWYVFINYGVKWDFLFSHRNFFAFCDVEREWNRVVTV